MSALNAGTKNVNLCHLENQTRPGTNKEGLASLWYELQKTLWAKISIQQVTAYCGLLNVNHRSYYKTAKYILSEGNLLMLLEFDI